MDTMSAMAMGFASQGAALKVFDWDTAARLIRDRQPDKAVAGLSGDMEYTSGSIYHNGEPVEEMLTDTFLASTWATPVLVLDNGEEIPCFLMSPDTGWDEDTYWPYSAIKILHGED